MSDSLPSLMQLVAAIATVGAVTSLVLAGFELYQRLHQRYLTQLGAADAGMLAGIAPEAESGSLQALRATVVKFLSVMSERFVPEKRLEQLEAALRKAGHPLEMKATEIVAFMELGAFCGLLFAIVVITVWLGLSPIFWIPFVLLGAAYPLIWLRDKIKARHHAIVRALPYNLDLLTLSVEAGLDFAAAIGKVVEKGRKGPLADELATTLRELKLGKTREEALRNLSGRVDLPTLSSFVHALIQADKMGTPLGKILRILSTQMRIERTQRAEKLANEAPVKLLFPLICFIFPTIFIMLFGPIAYQVFFGGTY